MWQVSGKLFERCLRPVVSIPIPWQTSKLKDFDFDHSAKSPRLPLRISLKELVVELIYFCISFYWLSAEFFLVLANLISWVQVSATHRFLLRSVLVAQLITKDLVSASWRIVMSSRTSIIQNGRENSMTQWLQESSLTWKKRERVRSLNSLKRFDQHYLVYYTFKDLEPHLSGETTVDIELSNIYSLYSITWEWLENPHVVPAHSRTDLSFKIQGWDLIPTAKKHVWIITQGSSFPGIAGVVSKGSQNTSPRIWGK